MKREYLRICNLTWGFSFSEIKILMQSIFNYRNKIKFAPRNMTGWNLGGPITYQLGVPVSSSENP